MNIGSIITSAAQIPLQPVEVPRIPLNQPSSQVSPGSFREILTQSIQEQANVIATQPSNASAGLHPTYQNAIGQSSNVITGMIQDVQRTQNRAEAITKNVLEGKSESLHSAMIAMEEASVSFQMLVEMRNKIVESMQELMRMQI
jgi:flagellar hook-basal body complex protein FliE